MCIRDSSKISEIEDSYKTEMQSLQNTVEKINKNSIQSECVNNSKFMLIKQSVSNVKDELSGAISQKLNNVTEQILITRDVNNDIELESFSCDSRVVHPMQFLNHAREFSKFNHNNWEVQL